MTTPPLPRPTWPAGFCGQIGADAYSADQLEATRAPLLAEIERLTAELAAAREGAERRNTEAERAAEAQGRTP